MTFTSRHKTFFKSKRNEFDKYEKVFMQRRIVLISKLHKRFPHFRGGKKGKFRLQNEIDCISHEQRTKFAN